MKLLPSLSQHVHNRLKDVIFQVVWTNLGDCQNNWFPAVDGDHSQGTLQELEVKSEEFEIEDKFLFRYDDTTCTARLDQATAFSSFFTNETIYQMAGKECCIALDVALAMSGCEQGRI